MNELESAQEQARRFNEDEAVWRAFERRRAARRLARGLTPELEEALERLDWEAAEREARPVRAIGFFHDSKP